MILVDLLTGVGPGVVVGVAWVVVVAGPGDSDGAAIGAGVPDSVNGSLGVTGDPTGVENGVGGDGQTGDGGVSGALSGIGVGVVGLGTVVVGVDGASAAGMGGAGAADMCGDGPGWAVVTGENFRRN